MSDPIGLTAPHVVVTFWGVRTARVPLAVSRMALDRRHLRGVPGLRFAKLLGTGDGRTFTLRDADPHHWGLLTVWDDGSAAARFQQTSATYPAWDRIAHERLDVALRPLSSKGRWAGREPFGAAPPQRHDGPVAALTRARLRARTARRFWASVPPVSADLRAVAGLELAVGIGEAPIGLQGTFSLWESGDALTEFAHRRSPHAQVAARTPVESWYVEELFARFAVVDLSGTFAGARPLNGRRRDRNTTGPAEEGS